MSKEIKVRYAEGKKCCGSCVYRVKNRSSQYATSHFCALDQHYVGYLEGFTNVCDEWEENTYD